MDSCPILAVDLDEVIPIVALIGTSIAFIAWISYHHRHRTRIAELEAEARENQDRLKALMIQRGMTAEEIERVLKLESVQPRLGGPDSDPEAQIVKALTDNDYSGGDIRRIVKAVHDSPNGATPELARIIRTMAGGWQKARDIEEYVRHRHHRERPA